MKRWHLVIVICVLCASSTKEVRAQAGVKGANWLRTNHTYNNYGVTDPRRVAWNLEFAQDIPGTLGQAQNLATLYASYAIKTLVRFGHFAKPTATEVTALQAASFSGCSSINTLMTALDNEVNNAGTLTALGGFILGNEVNLASEWGLNGTGYGRVYNCYLARWNLGIRASSPLLLAGPGGCVVYNCPGFYQDVFTQIGTNPVDGFAIHAYGQTGAAFATDFTWQVNRINQSKPGAAAYITEYNSGASYGSPLPNLLPTPTAYFNDCHQQVANYNNGHNNQIKALLYFADSPDSWTRVTASCHPAVAPQTAGWWQTSLCYDGARHGAWYASGSAPPPPSDGANVSFASAPVFVMPGQISRVSISAFNSGGTTWASGSTSPYRLGAAGGNGFQFSVFPQCDGYFRDILDARAYTCSTTSPGITHAYQLDVRAPTSGVTNATISVQMVRDGVAWFGNVMQRAVGIGSAFCGTAVTQCIINRRADILPFYAANGWNTSCWNRDAIIANWCAASPQSAAECNTLKIGTCASFNNGTRCYNGVHLGNAIIDPAATFNGYRVCGSNRFMYECRASPTANWYNTGLMCN